MGKWNIQKARDNLKKAEQREFIGNLLNDCSIDDSVEDMLAKLKKETGATVTDVSKFLNVEQRTVSRWAREDTNREQIFFVCYWLMRQVWFELEKINFGFDEE